MPSSQSERPVLFQKYFKSANRTYASQVKLAASGKRFLILTEGTRDPETAEVKKHYLRVFENDLKEFFSMLQETVVFLRANRQAPAASDSSVAGPPETAERPRSGPSSSSKKAAAKPPVQGKPAGGQTPARAATKQASKSARCGANARVR